MPREPSLKKNKLEVFDVPAPEHGTRSSEEVEKAFADAVKVHPFFDNVHSVADIYKDGVFRDGKGNVVGVLVKQGLPAYAAEMAADVLRSAAVRTSLRANMFGGDAPLSGIAGYFDYRGSPVEHKYRKTAFTYEHEETWPNVFPMIDYVSEIYKRAAPDSWAKQDAAIPDVVRIHGSPFSTLTINSRFRTAHHTDAGDFDDGYGCLACLEGPYKGLALTLDDFRVNFVMEPRDVLIFNPHHFHSNTELEMGPDKEWQRLTCVFYYRAALGEAAGYAEYSRRLKAALQGGATLRVPPAIRTIAQKENGENRNRAAPVHPVALSPFALTCIQHQLSHCGAAGACLHDCLLAGGDALAAALFGEPLTLPSGRGLPDRADEALERPHIPLDAFRSPAMGGFRECDLTLQAAAERQRCLEPAVLAEQLTPELLEMWETAKAHWLALVGQEWAKLTERDKTRTNFTWNNRSEMNTAFFDLCEVAKQVLLGLLDADTASAKEEQSFWVVFAAHLNAACVATLEMPPDAMSLKKLNVKIKDFTFGGTRYFKDMPEEVQRQRMQRKARIEAARRGGDGGSAARRRGGEWLANDSFDYQTEDRVVEYDGVERVDPRAHATAVVRSPDDMQAMLEASRALAGSPLTVRVRVVLPAPPGARDSAAAGGAAGLTKAERASKERERLLENPAAKQVLAAAGPCSVPLPSDRHVTDAKGNTVHISYAYPTDALSGAGDTDFVVLQHVLTALPDDAEAAAFVQRVARRTAGAVLVAETDVWDRQYFRLKAAVREAYTAVAESCFTRLHGARYGTAPARLRSKAEMEALLPSTCARYKLQGSPLNTALSVLPGLARLSPA